MLQYGYKRIRKEKNIMLIRKAMEQDFEAYMNVSKGTCYSMELKGSPKQNSIQSNCLTFFANNEADKKEVFFQMIQNGEVFLLEEEGQVIASAAVKQQNKTFKILDFVVMADKQAKGIGTYFAKTIIKSAKKERAKKVWLYCGFKGAQEFWKTLGFKETAQNHFEKIL